VNATTVRAWSARSVDQAQLAAAITTAVIAAVDGVRRTFTENPVHAWPDGQGGALVVIDGIDLGPTWTPPASWLGFDISYLHPDADCYPHYLRPDLQRAAGVPLTAPFHPDHKFDGLPAVMVSRRSPGRNPQLDTPALKALSVLKFIREQA
jgi:hypothetical protein